MQIFLGGIVGILGLITFGSIGIAIVIAFFKSL